MAVEVDLRRMATVLADVALSHREVALLMQTARLPEIAGKLDRIAEQMELAAAQIILAAIAYETLLTRALEHVPEGSDLATDMKNMIFPITIAPEGGETMDKQQLVTVIYVVDATEDEIKQQTETLRRNAPANWKIEDAMFNGKSLLEGSTS